MQHDVQHAKSSPSIKRDIYNCENRFSETENLLLNNKTEISNGSMTNITYTTAVWSEGTPSGNLFVAPKTGWYFLAAEGAHESDGTDGKAFQVKLRCNGDITMSSSGIISGTMIAAFVAGIAHLNKGDIVRPYVHIANANVIFAFRGKWALLQSE